MIPRISAEYIEKLARVMPAICLVGPRQSGKTTLARAVFPNHAYVSLEDLDERMFAQEDPRGFFARYSAGTGLIIDEVQHVPILLSYMQTLIDQESRNGFFVITGSQNLLVNEAISQTLAGRIAVVTLYPFSLQELASVNAVPESLEQMLWKGCFPRLYVYDVPPDIWYADYIQSYVERDVRQIKNIFDLSLFQRFLKLCAGRVGQVLNIASLSSDAGIDQKTARSWLSLLEATYVIILLQPFYKNVGKRLIKSPKLYFVDTGLACSLLSLRRAEDVVGHYAKGGLMESLIVSDLYKQSYNQMRRPNCYFWRDQVGVEMDLLIESAHGVRPVEIKAGMTMSGDYVKPFSALASVFGDQLQEPTIVYTGQTKPFSHQIQLVNWRDAGALDVE